MAWISSRLWSLRRAIGGLPLPVGEIIPILLNDVYFSAIKKLNGVHLHRRRHGGFFPDKK
jgi:hypothetical protein